MKIFLRFFARHRGLWLWGPDFLSQMNQQGRPSPGLRLGYIKKDDKSYYLPVTTQLFGDYVIKRWNNKDPY